MALAYGVLRGKIDIFKREDDLDTPHLQIKVIDGQNKAWRVPVNVLSADQSFLIFHRVDPLQSHPLLANLPQVASGFTLLPAPSRSASTAVDYLRAPLFDWPTGVAVPSTRPGENDDLQDMLIAYLKQLKAQNGEIFAFGARFPEPGEAFSPRPIDGEMNTTQGVHDIHMNQGNPHPGRFAKDNGVFQDGGLILRFPTRFVALMLRFQTQWLPTDNSTGHPLPNAQPIPPGSAPGTEPPQAPPPIANPAVYIERALVNPPGTDTKKESIVLGNTTSAPVDLSGWSLVDKNDNAETIAALSLPPGKSRLVLLSGRSAQLGNKGGTIRLKNKQGVQIHAVTYSQEDAKEEGRYVRFNT
ncbi:MAG: DUF2278 family protein [Deltaproteobacteria bacterium]|nr:DUF2278 family protein [Deltaproteobacteria bacterium]